MQHGKSYFFIGIGGSGMMPLAMILAGAGAHVAGSDRSLDQARLPAKFDALRRLGIDLFAQDGSGITNAGQIVIASAAIEDDVPDIIAAKAIGAHRMSRAELLSTLFNQSPCSIGIAGTSGKSTVTGMIGWILHACDRAPTVMNGAVMKNFARPEAPFASALVGEGDIFVSEIDESDGSIALYRPNIAVLNNISLDHKSIEELRGLFADFAGRAQTVIVNIGDPEAAALAASLKGKAITFAVEGTAHYAAENLAPAPFSIGFDLITADGRRRVTLGVPGRHNVANALAAIAACVAAGVSIDGAVAAVENFAGLRRRFDHVGSAHGIDVIDDFGHNPDKIAATLDTLHAFPGRLLILFQPHGYGPLKVMRHDLVASIAARMNAGDIIVLPDPVYQGGTTNRAVTSADIVADLIAAGIDAEHIADRAAAADRLAAAARRGDRIVVMGARDDTLSLLAADIVEKIAPRGDLPDGD